MKYVASEDIGFSTVIESDDSPEQAWERADARIAKAWDVIERALMSRPELGVDINGRYDDDLCVYEDETGKLVAGARH